MSNRIPFVAYADIRPEAARKRWEIIRSRERIAALIYSDLTAYFANTGTEPAESGTDSIAQEHNPVIDLASPGGSGEWGLAASPDSLSSLVETVAIKPQFGEEPDTVTITGFYKGTGTIPYPTATILCNGEYVTGPIGAPGWNSALNPSAANVADVIALKAALEAAVVSTQMTVIRIEIAGIVYGRGGFHFPRP